MAAEPNSDLRGDVSQEGARPASQRVGKYEILAHIATGGMGAVYKARDSELGRIVALKIIPQETTGKPAAMERFRREARSAAKLLHENIVTLYEFGEANGVWYLALEYVDGIDLQEYIDRKGRLKPEKARRILVQAARALDHAHKQGIVHRDIKPANFLLTRRDGRLLVKLTDLGLAREAREDEFRVTRVGSTVGSIDYMSPEQARDSRAADIRSDIYSLGCTFYHMLAGKPPFPEGSLTERLFQHIEAEPPDVRQFSPRVSEELALVLQRMLAKKPEERYQTPTQLLHDLVHGPRPPAQPPLARPGREFASDNQDSGIENPDLDSSGRPGSDPFAPTPEPQGPPPPPRRKRRGVPKRPPEPDSLILPPINPEQRRAAAGQYERASEVVALGNYDYGIQLLRSCCKLDPYSIAYRQMLRLTEKRKYHDNQRGSSLAWLSTLVTKARLRAAGRAGDHLRVLSLGEDILVFNPWDVGTQLAMAESADRLGLLSMAVWILEEARQKDDVDVTVNRTLARLYEKRGNFTQAVALWELVAKAAPTDSEAHQKATDLAANETIQRGRYLEEIQRSIDAEQRGS
jgi:serine/threonine-protein kinase